MLDREKGGYVLSEFRANIFLLTGQSLVKSMGFTLVELMVVVSILAITITLGIPSYRGWVQNTQIYNAAESAENGLQKAKAEATKRNTTVEFVLGTNPPWQIQLPGSAVIETSTTEGAKNVVATATPAGADTVTFNSLGGVVSPNPTANANGVTATLTQIDFDSGVLAGSRNLRVTIGLGGITRMCDPNLAAGSSPRAC
jgi:type IV fimbrial biogenesis protein FimT